MEPMILKNISGGGSSESGEAVEFGFETMDGKQFRFVAPSNVMSGMIRFFIELCVVSGQQYEKVHGKRRQPTEADVELIECEDLAIGKGRTPQELVLAANLRACQLYFAVPTKHMLKLPEAIKKTLGNSKPGKPH
jgi:hypothetical protein